jgi:crossover junction endodeoxyribonuclease RuvC
MHDATSKPRRILGIDPGLRITGYAVLEFAPVRPKICEAGIIKTAEDTTDVASRILSVYKGIGEILEQFHPEVMVVEQLYAHYKHPRTAILMGHARGVILLAAAEREIPIIHYSATRVKKTVTGSGHAAKDQVQRTIQREMGLPQLPEPPDVADALAVALCHYYQQQIRT